MVSAWVSNVHRTYHTVDAITIILAGGRCMLLSCARACWLRVRACALWLLCAMMVGRLEPAGRPLALTLPPWRADARLGRLLGGFAESISGAQRSSPPSYHWATSPHQPLA